MSRYLAIAFGVSLSFTGTGYAQVPANAVVTVRGCVSPVQRDGSLAAKAGATATANTATDEANNPDPTGVFMLLDATQENEPAAAKPSNSANGSRPSRGTYTLAGHESELSKQNGYRVEIAGTIVPTIGSGLPKRTDVAADGVQRIRVTSVKRIAGSCSATKK